MKKQEIVDSKHGFTSKKKIIKKMEIGVKATLKEFGLVM